MKRRKIIAAIVLLCGVALFFAIIGGSSSSNGPLVLAKAGGGSGSLDYTSSGITNTPSSSNSGTTANGASGNMTDSLISGYAQNILQMNNGFSGTVPNATNTVSFPSVDSMTNQLSASLNQTLPFKTFSTNDILVTNDNSITSQLNYIYKVGGISRRNFANFPQTTLANVIDQAVSKGNPTLLNEYVAIINQEISDLLAVTVPPSLSSWHLQDLNLWEEKLTVFTAIADINADPLKGAIALNQVNDIAGKDQALQTQIENTMVKLTAN